MEKVYQQKKWHALPVQEVMKSLESSPDGLSGNEAEKRIKKYGKNEIPEKNGEKVIGILISQFKNPLIYILIIAGVISSFLREFIDAYIIFGAVVINTAIGFWQELKVSHILEELTKTLSYESVVLRGGKISGISSKKIVPGDIIIVKQGDKVPADARLVEASNLKTNEAVLTGESSPVDKIIAPLKEAVPAADRVNMVYLGTYIEEGVAKAVVTGTGIDTEFGKIAYLLKKRGRKTETPLKIRFNKLSKILGLVFLAVSSALFALGILRGLDPFSIFITAVAVAVAAIPESLPIALTVTLAIGAKRIFKKGGLVRKIAAAETLGSTTVIAADKTATLTEGKMSISKIVFSDNRELAGEEIKNVPFGNEAPEQKAMKLLALSTKAFIKNPSSPSSEWDMYGPVIDKAILFTIAQSNFKKEEIEKEAAPIDEIPFNSSYKYSATMNRLKDDKNSIIVLGAPETLWKASNKYLGENGNYGISAEKEDWFNKTLNGLAEKGLKVLALAYTEVPSKFSSLDYKLIGGLTFVSFVAFSDQIRKDVPEAIKTAKNAGIRVVMITGDHALTAKYVARELNLFKNNDDSRIIEGRDLEKNPDLLKNTGNYDVFARITPEYKVKIIEALKEGDTVAMIGDGINDAPSLVKADMGVALGSGADVAKEASDLVLVNNSFSIIVEAVRQGRIIFDNIRKSVVFLLSDAFSEIVLIAGSILAGLPLALTAAQILWVNIIEEGLPAISLAFEKGEAGIMARKPLKKEEIFSGAMKKLIILFILITDTALLFLFYFSLKLTGNLEYARTMTFFALGITSFFYVFSVKSLTRPIWRINIFSNKFLLWSVAVGFVLYLLSIYLAPFAGILQTAPLGIKDWIILLGIGFLNIFAIEIGKILFIRTSKK